MTLRSVVADSSPPTRLLATWTKHRPVLQRNVGTAGLPSSKLLGAGRGNAGLATPSGHTTAPTRYRACRFNPHTRALPPTTLCQCIFSLVRTPYLHTATRTNIHSSAVPALGRDRPSNTFSERHKHMGTCTHIPPYPACSCCYSGAAQPGTLVPVFGAVYFQFLFLGLPSTLPGAYLRGKAVGCVRRAPSFSSYSSSHLWITVGWRARMVRSWLLLVGGQRRRTYTRRRVYAASSYTHHRHYTNALSLKHNFAQLQHFAQNVLVNTPFGSYYAFSNVFSNGARTFTLPAAPRFARIATPARKHHLPSAMPPMPAALNCEEAAPHLPTHYHACVPGSPCH